MGQLTSVVEANQRFAESFDQGDLEIPPARNIAVLTCIDARIDPARVLGLDIGDAHVIRNAGGRATDDAVRSLLISSWLLGTREFLVIHHTDCGMGRFTDDAVAEIIAERSGRTCPTWTSSRSATWIRASGTTSTGSARSARSRRTRRSLATCTTSGPGRSRASGTRSGPGGWRRWFRPSSRSRGTIASHAAWGPGRAIAARASVR